MDFAYEALSELEALPDQSDRVAAMILHFLERGDEKSLRYMIDDAEENALSFDGLSRAAAFLIRREANLGPMLAFWTARHLTGQIKCPARPPSFRRFWQAKPRNAT